MAPVDKTDDISLRWWGMGGAGLGAQRYVAVQRGPVYRACAW